MGFDRECIRRLHTYSREFFCIVCGTLALPNEALQAMCRHLFCKLCLLSVAYGSSACPCDGSPVTESNSKPLLDSDKGLAEKIGKVKVHCLYLRSGCAWQGVLSACSSHVSRCMFGNSPVICIKCGLRMMHRQVKEHAQDCYGTGRILCATRNQNTPPAGFPHVYPPIPSSSGQFTYQILQPTQNAVQYPSISGSGHIFYQQNQHGQNTSEALQQRPVLTDPSTTRCLERAAVGPGAVTGHVPGPEFGGPRNIPHHLPFHQSVIGGGSRNPHVNEPRMGRGYSHDRNPAGDVDSFDQLRMRKPARDMDRGKDNKQLDRKKQRVSGGVVSPETGSGTRKVGGHGSNPQP